METKYLSPDVTPEDGLASIEGTQRGGFKADWSCLYDKLIVKREAAKQTYDAEGLLAVADAHKQQQNVGTVIRAGDGRWVDGILLPLTIKPGMTVLFSKFAGVPLEGAHPDLLILREDEVLAYRS